MQEWVEVDRQDVRVENVPWTRVTYVMEVPLGCLILVSHQNDDIRAPRSDTMTFVPGVGLGRTEDIMSKPCLNPLPGYGGPPPSSSSG
jgi:hypothetical protein